MPKTRLATLIVFLTGAVPSYGQEVLQTGIAAWPGIGTQVNYIRARETYAWETAMYFEVEPSFGDARTTFVVSGGVGAAVRPLGILRFIGQADYGYDLDVGVRLGPSLLFRNRATHADRNQQFRLFLDPFVRLLLPRNQRTWFVEIGPSRPVVRAGFWLQLTRN